MIPKTSPGRVLMFGLAGAALALVQTSFLGVFSYPFDIIDLPLVLVIGLVATYSFPAAFAAAAGAGLVRDALSADPFGWRTAVALLLAASLVTLFRRVFTDISFFSVSIMSALGFGLQTFLQFCLARTLALLDGRSAAAARYGFAALVGGMVIETVCCVLLLRIFSRRRAVRYNIF